MFFAAFCPFYRPLHNIFTTFWSVVSSAAMWRWSGWRSIQTCDHSNRFRRVPVLKSKMVVMRRRILMFPPYFLVCQWTVPDVLKENILLENILLENILKENIHSWESRDCFIHPPYVEFLVLLLKFCYLSPFVFHRSWWERWTLCVCLIVKSCCLSADWFSWAASGSYSHFVFVDVFSLRQHIQLHS